MGCTNYGSLDPTALSSGIVLLMAALTKQEVIDQRVARGLCRFGNHPNDRSGKATSCTACWAKYKKPSKAELGRCSSARCSAPSVEDGRCLDCSRHFKIRKNQDPEVCPCGEVRVCPGSPCVACSKRTHEQYLHNKVVHRANNKAAMRRNKDRRRASGLCLNPSTADHPNDGLGAYCSSCSKKGTEKEARKRARRRAEGTCPQCPEATKAPLEAHITACPTCTCKGSARRFLGASGRWDELCGLLQGQDGHCPLCSVVLTLGFNAELDHVVPKSAGGAEDLSNLQWLCAPCNIDKWDRSQQAVIDHAAAITLTDILSRMDWPAESLVE